MSSDGSSKTFFKPINRQRISSNSQLQSLVVGGKTCETDEEIRDDWATHLQKLATPLESDMFDKEYKQMIDLDIDTINVATRCMSEDRPISPIREKEVSIALKRLNNNKAVDVMGLTSNIFYWEGVT